MDHIIILRNTYKELGDIRNKLRFFELCQKSGIIPSGLSLCFNLALGVNDSDLINKIVKTPMSPAPAWRLSSHRAFPILRQSAPSSTWNLGGGDEKD